jgi:hypothetical protein
MAENASATCKSMPDCRRCPTVESGCRKAKSLPPLRVASGPASVDRQIPSPNGGSCPNFPGCCCQPQCPVAPQPRGQEDEESNLGPARVVAASGWLGIVNIDRSLIGLPPPSISSSQKSPLYLRNSRLLI